VSTPKSPFRRWLGSRGHHRPDALSDTTSKATRDCDFISIALPWPPQFGGSGQNVSARSYYNLLAASYNARGQRVLKRIGSMDADARASSV
jgi:hypothetical protein